MVLRALVLVNYQLDYFAGGAVPVPGAEATIPIVKSLRSKAFDYFILTRLWHPIDHKYSLEQSDFCSVLSPETIRYEFPSCPCSHRLQRGFKEKEIIPLDHGPQLLYPDYCIAGFQGSGFHPSLEIRQSDIILDCGTNPVYDNCTNSSVAELNCESDFCALMEIVKRTHITHLYFAGFTIENGIQYTILDANVFCSCSIYFIRNASAGYDTETCSIVLKRFEYERVHIIDSQSDEIEAILNLGSTSVFRPTDLVDNVICSSGAALSSSGDMCERAFPWIDIRLSIQDMPEDLRGYFFIHSCNSDKLSTEENYLQFQVINSIRLVILASPDTSPSWLTDRFRKVENDVITLSNGSTLIVWEGKKCFLGEIVSLGGNCGSATDPRCLNYVVAFRYQNVDDLVLPKLIITSSEEEVKRFIATGNDLFDVMQPMEYTALHTCAIVNSHRILSLLLDMKLPVNAKDIHGNTPLHLACRYGHLEVRVTFCDSSSQAVNVLVAAREVNLNAVNELNGFTPLIVACLYSHLSIVNSLLRSRADASIATPSGYTALHFCFNSSDAYQQIFHSIISSKLTMEDQMSLLMNHNIMGFLDKIHWNPLRDVLQGIPINDQTARQHGLIHLAVWNGHSSTVQFIVFPKFVVDWKPSLQLNEFNEVSGYNELDLALLRDDVESAKHLVRGGFHVNRCTGILCHRLLHYMLLMGETDIVEGLLRYDENNLEVDDPLIKLLKRIRYTRCCTFSFAGFSNPITQYMYSCSTCNSTVCTVCKHQCHKDHEVDPLGLVKDTYCACNKSKCLVLIHLNERETAGYRFEPNPIDASSLELPEDEDYEPLAVSIAKSDHSKYVAAQLQLGWTYDEDLSTEALQSPLMADWHDLSPEFQRNYISDSLDQLALVDFFGFQFIRVDTKVLDHYILPPEEQYSYFFSKGNYRGLLTSLPIDTSGVNLTENQRLLVSMLSENNHAMWAEDLMKQGWRFGQITSEISKISSEFVPFRLLSDTERLKFSQPAEDFVKSVVAMGFTCVGSPRDAALDKDSLFSESISDSQKKQEEQEQRIKKYKSNIQSVFFRASSRLGNLEVLKLIRQSSTDSVINCRDNYHHSPLYIASKRGHHSIVEWLLQNGAKCNIFDRNGLTPLMVASFNGHANICRILLASGADPDSRDNRGFTALHHAAANGNSEIISILGASVVKTVDQSVEPMVPKAASRWWKPNVKNSGSLGVIGSGSVFSMGEAFHSENAFSSRAATDEDGVSSSVLEANYDSMPIAGKMLFTDLKSNTTFKNRAVLIERYSQYLIFVQPHMDLYSPLTLAVKSGKVEVIRALLDNGADPLKEDCTGISPFGRALLKLASSLVYHRDQIPVGSNMLTIQNSWEVQIRGSLKEKEEQEQLCKEIINNFFFSPQIRNLRFVTAIKIFVLKAIAFLLYLALLITFSPLAYDFGNVNEIHMNDVIVKEMSSRISSINSMSEFIPWLVTVIDPADDLIEQDHRGFLIFKTDNLIAGSMRLEKESFLPVTCHKYHGYRHTDGMRPCFDGSVSKSHIDVPMVFLNETMQFLQQIDHSGWVDNKTSSIVMIMNLYNPHYKFFAVSKSEFRHNIVGNFSKVSSTLTGRFIGRFPPSILFDIILLAMVLIETYWKFREVKSLKILKEDGWLIYEIMIILLTIVLLSYDVYMNVIMINYHLYVGIPVYVDLQYFSSTLLIEYDIFSLFLTMVGFRFTKYLRLIPTWGPMVLAVVLTLQHSDVILYLFVMLAIMFVFAISYTVLAANDRGGFENIIAAFYSLFRSSFTTQWWLINSFRDFTGILFFILYSLIALILINSLIGIVTDLYPHIREKAVHQWETLMIEYLIDKEITEQRDQKNRFAMRRPSLVLGMVEDNYLGTLMEGMDGTHYWTPHGMEGKTGKKKQDNVLSLYHDDKRTGVEKNLLKTMAQKSDQISQIKTQLEKFNMHVTSIASQLDTAGSIIEGFKETQEKSVDVSRSPILVRRPKTNR